MRTFVQECLAMAITIKANIGEILSEVPRSIFHAPMGNALTDAHLGICCVIETYQSMGLCRLLSQQKLWQLKRQHRQLNQQLQQLCQDLQQLCQQLQQLCQDLQQGCDQHKHWNCVGLYQN